MRSLEKKRFKGYMITVFKYMMDFQVAQRLRLLPLGCYREINVILCNNS